MMDHSPERLASPEPPAASTGPIHKPKSRREGRSNRFCEQTHSLCMQWKMHTCFGACHACCAHHAGPGMHHGVNGGQGSPLAN